MGELVYFAVVSALKSVDYKSVNLLHCYVLGDPVCSHIQHLKSCNPVNGTQKKEEAILHITPN